MGARHFGVKAEATWATIEAPTRFFEALTESVQKEINFESLEVIRQFSPVDIMELNSAARGDVEFLANYDGLGILFEHLIGSVDTDTTTPAGGNTHTFPASTGIPDADRIGLSLSGEFRRDGSLVWRYGGLKIVSWSHSFSVDQVSRVTMGLLGALEQQTTTYGTASFPTILPLAPHHVAVKFDGTTLPARSCTIEVDTPVDETFILGQTTLGREPDRAGVLRVTGTAEVLFENNTQYAKFDGSTDVDVHIEAVNGTYALKYIMNKSRLTQATPHNAGRDRLIATYEWESYYDTDATENLQVVLQNGDATP